MSLPCGLARAARGGALSIGRQKGRGAGRLRADGAAATRRGPLLPRAAERLSGGISHRTCNACSIRVFARLDRICGDWRGRLVASGGPSGFLLPSE
jgi:hypothetical protein